MRYFLFFLMILFSTLAQAEIETVPSTSQTEVKKVCFQLAAAGGGCFSSAEGVCSKAYPGSTVHSQNHSLYGMMYSCKQGDQTVSYSFQKGADACYTKDGDVGRACGTEPTCPDSTWTLSADQKTCSREKNPCPVGEKRSNFGWWTGTYSFGRDGAFYGPGRNSLPASICDGQCIGSVSSKDGFAANLAGGCWSEKDADGNQQKGAPIFCYADVTLTGETCNADQKDNAPLEPIVETKTKEVEKYSDGSEKRQDLNTFCKADMSWCTTIRETITDPNSDGLPGQAGTPGSSTKTTNTSGSGSGSGSGTGGDGDGSGSGTGTGTGTGGTGTGTGGTGTGTGSGGSGITVDFPEFPDDYVKGKDFEPVGKAFEEKESEDLISPDQELKDKFLSEKDFMHILSWRVPGHASICPTPTIDMPYLNKSYVINSHCQIFQDNAFALRASMMAFFSILSVFIVMKA